MAPPGRVQCAGRQGQGRSLPVLSHSKCCQMRGGRGGASLELCSGHAGLRAGAEMGRVSSNFSGAKKVAFGLSRPFGVGRSSA